MTIWPQLCNSHMREVPNPEEQMLLVDTVIFSWIKTSTLQKETFSNNSANAYFHLQTSGFSSPFHIPFSKSRLFPYHFKHTQRCLSYLSKNLLAALAPSDMPWQSFHDNPKERLCCFKPASPSSQSQGHPTATGSKHHTHNGGTIAAPSLQGNHIHLNQVSEKRAGSCLRWTTGR